MRDEPVERRDVQRRGGQRGSGHDRDRREPAHVGHDQPDRQNEHAGQGHDRVEQSRGDKGETGEPHSPADERGEPAQDEGLRKRPRRRGGLGEREQFEAAVAGRKRGGEDDGERPGAPGADGVSQNDGAGEAHHDGCGRNDRRCRGRAGEGRQMSKQDGEEGEVGLAVEAEHQVPPDAGRIEIGKRARRIDQAAPVDLEIGAADRPQNEQRQKRRRLLRQPTPDGLRCRECWQPGPWLQIDRPLEPHGFRSRKHPTCRLRLGTLIGRQSGS